VGNMCRPPVERGAKVRGWQGVDQCVSAWAKRVGIVIALTFLSIEVHELGHLAVYRLAGQPARMSFQRVDPVGAVAPSLRIVSKLAGPVVSLVAAAILLAVAWRRPGFVWATAAFTNASIRILPCTLDVVRAARNRAPFSDEGDVALAISASPAVRSVLVAVPLLLSLALTIAAARAWRFPRHAFRKSLGIYAGTLALGIGVILLDEVLGFRGS